MQEITAPDQIEQARFSTALRGYDKNEVDAYLRTVATSIRSLIDSSENAYHKLGQELGDLLQHAKDSADELTKRAEADAAAMREKTETDCTELRRQAEADATDAMREAQMDAAQMRQEAERDAARLRGEAESDAAGTRNAAEQEASERISAAGDKVDELRRQESEVREQLRLLRLKLSDLTSRLQQFEAPDERILDAPGRLEAEGARKPIEKSSDASGSDGTAEDKAGRAETIRLEAEADKSAP